MQPHLTHIALHVRSLAASCRFYEDYCGLRKVHSRAAHHVYGDDAGKDDVAWMAEPGMEKQFVLVLIGGRAGGRDLAGAPVTAEEALDLTHLGFSLPTQAAVDAVAARAGEAGLLRWPARQEPYPVGYYCGVVDPDGNIVEFSFGQPLGPGSAEWPK